MSFTRVKHYTEVRRNDVLSGVVNQLRKVREEVEIKEYEVGVLPEKEFYDSYKVGNSNERRQGGKIFEK